MTRLIRMGALLFLLLGMVGTLGAPVHSVLAATTFTVSDCSGEYGTGGTSAAPASGSLAWAVGGANADNASDTVTFSCGGTITISSTLTISGSMTIDGSGQNVTLDAHYAVDQLVVNSDAALYLQSLTLVRGGSDSVGANGSDGAIHNNGALTVSNSTFGTSSTAGTLANAQSGNVDGAVYTAATGTTTITNSTFSNNSSSNGGAVYNATGGTTTITGSTFFRNDSSASGGAVYNATGGTMSITNSAFGTFGGNVATNAGGAVGNQGSMTITDSFFNGNTASSYNGDGGGAIADEAGGNLTITTSTFTSNTGETGGALLIYGASATVTNSTFNLNNTLGCNQSDWTTAVCYGTSTGVYTGNAGGAIANTAGSLTITGSTVVNNWAWGRSGGIDSMYGTTHIGGTIVADNGCGGPLSDCAHNGGICVGGYGGQWIDSGYNMQDSSRTCNLNGPTDVTGDPQLGSLADNGGLTQTLALASTSPAIDKIPSGNPLCLATDQRGFTRPAGAGCDIGAYEYDAGLSLGCPTFSSLSSAIANAHGQGDHIFLLSCDIPTTINFDSTLIISKNIRLDASASPGAITFDGKGSVQLFTVNTGNSFGLKGLTLSHGSGPSGGAGAINSAGALTITASTFSVNSGGQGGAIRNTGSATVTNSTFTRNSTTTSGGAIRGAGDLTVTNSTFSGNTAAAYGGALYTGGHTIVIGSTFSGNSAGTSGGALYGNNTTAPMYVGGTIIANNSGGNCDGTLSDAGYNLEWTGSRDTSTGYTCGLSSAKHDIVGSDPNFVSDSSGNPLLTDNGGPTKTIALQSTSPAIDEISTGVSFTSYTTPHALCLASGGTDQRGDPRPFPANGACDIGAYEYQPASTSDTTPPTVTVTTTPASVPGGQSGYFNASNLPVTVTVSASDASGVTNLSCTDAVNGGSPTSVTVGSQSGSSPRTGTVSLSADGTHAISCTATDSASNTGAASDSTNTATFSIDGTAPTSTALIACGILPCSGPYSGPVSITLSAVDNANGSGVSKIVYTTDGSTPSASNGTVYGLPFTISSPTTVEYAAIDNAGNVETVHTQTVSFLSSTSLTVSAASGTYGGTTTLSATLTSGGSPVGNQTVTFSLNGTSVGTATTDSSGTATLSGASASLAGIGTGTYPSSGSCDATTGVSGSFTRVDPYAGSSACNTLTVAKKDLHVTASHPAISYGAAPPDSSSYTLSYDSSDFVGSDGSSVVTGSPDCSTDYTSTSDVGSYAISCAIGTLGAANYRLVSGYSGSGSTDGQPLSSATMRLGTLDVNPASPNFSFDLLGLPTVTYGDADFSVAPYATSSTGKISFTTGPGSVGCTVGTDGTVHISAATSGTDKCVVEASLTPGSSNYTAPSPVDRSFSIAPKAITLQASSPADQTFGSITGPSVDCTPTGFLSGDGFGSNAPVGAVYASASDTSPMTVTSTTGAGTYVTKCTGGDPGSNYTITTRTDGSFTVDKKPIQVMASHVSMTFGDAAPSSFTITYSNDWVSPNMQSSIVDSHGYAPSCTTTYTASSSVSGGPYEIDCTLGSLKADNYTFVSGYSDANNGQPLPSSAPGFQLGQLTVHKADQTISFSTNAPTDAVYGDTYKPVASSNSSLGVSLGATGACSYSNGTVTMTGVGSCTVTANQSGDGNYKAATQQTQVFDVGKKAVHVTASAGPLTYGSPKSSSYSTSYTAGDFVSGDTATTSSITGSLSCDTTYTSTSDVGTYPITCTSSLSSPHYTFVSGYSGAGDTSGQPLPGSTGTAIRLGTLTVNQAQGSVAIKNVPATPRYGGSFTPTYTTNSTGTTWTTSQTPAVCTVDTTSGLVSYGATGTCTLQAHVMADTNHSAADGSPQSFTINPAVGNVAYIGQTLFVTSGSNSTTAQVALSASVGGSAGDISNAKVTFIDSLTGTVLAKGVPVSPVAGATTPTGTANTIVTLSSGKYGAQSYLVKVVLDTAAGSEYTNVDQLADPTSKAYATVTVVVPATTNSMQGTADITPSGAAAGTYGTGINVHYTAGLTYNKGGTNPQGQIMLSLDMGGSTYYIKSNSITSIVCTTKTSPCKDLTVYTKASIYRIDSSGTTTSVDGNVTLRMDAHDGGASGDTIGFTILSSKTSALYYSNNWVYSSTSKSWQTAQQSVSNTNGEAVVIN